MTLEEVIELALWRLLPLGGVRPELVNETAKIITGLASQKLNKGKVDEQS